MQVETHSEDSMYIKQAVLTYHLNWLRSQEVDDRYCKYLVFKIMPLIRLIYPELVALRKQEKDSYLNLRKQFEKDVLSEITRIFEELKEALIMEALSDDPTIKNSCIALESILKFESEDGKVWAMPAQYEVAFERLKALCNAIARKKKELIADYVESFRDITEYRDNQESDAAYQCNYCFKLVCKRSLHAIHGSIEEDSVEPLCANCGNRLQKRSVKVAYQVPHVELFNEKKFVPSFFKLSDLQESFWGRPAGAWNVLCTIEYCWDIDHREYFRKNLYYNDPDACVRSVDLLILNLARKEACAIKKKKEEKVHFMNRNYIDNCLDTIIHKLYGNINFEEMPNVYGPDSIEIDLVFSVDLQLTVTWAPGIHAIYLMHSFRNEKDFRYKFFNALINNPGVFAPLSGSKRDTKKYLREAGIDKVLRDIFLHSADKNGATLKSKRFDRHQLSSLILEELREYLQRFLRVDWTRIIE